MPSLPTRTCVTNQSLHLQLTRLPLTDNGTRRHLFQHDCHRDNNSMRQDTPTAYTNLISLTIIQDNHDQITPTTAVHQIITVNPKGNTKGVPLQSGTPSTFLITTGPQFKTTGTAPPALGTLLPNSGCSEQQQRGTAPSCTSYQPAQDLMDRRHEQSYLGEPLLRKGTTLLISSCHSNTLSAKPPIP